MRVSGTDEMRPKAEVHVGNPMLQESDRPTAARELQQTEAERDDRMAWEEVEHLTQQQLTARAGDAKPKLPKQLGPFFAVLAFQSRLQWVFTRNGLLPWLVMVVVSCGAYLTIPMLWGRSSQVFCFGQLFAASNFALKALANRSIFGGEAGDGLHLFWVLQSSGDNTLAHFRDSPQTSQIKGYLTMFQTAVYGYAWLPALIQFWWFHRGDMSTIQHVCFAVFLLLGSMPIFAGVISQQFVVQSYVLEFLVKEFRVCAHPSNAITEKEHYVEEAHRNFASFEKCVEPFLRGWVTWFFVAEFGLVLSTALFCFASILVCAKYVEALEKGDLDTLDHSYIYLCLVTSLLYIWVSHGVFLRAVAVTRACKSVEKDCVAAYERIAVNGTPSNVETKMLRFVRHVQSKSLAFKGYGITVDDTLVSSSFYAVIALCVSLAAEKMAQADYIDDEGNGVGS